MNLEKLKEKIKEKGIKYNYLANILGIDKNTFSRKIKGKTSFTLEEIKTISKIINLNDNEKLIIFLS